MMTCRYGEKSAHCAELDNECVTCMRSRECCDFFKNKKKTTKPDVRAEFELLVSKILLEGRSGGWIKGSPFDIRIEKLRDVLAGRDSKEG